MRFFRRLVLFAPSVLTVLVLLGLVYGIGQSQDHGEKQSKKPETVKKAQKDSLALQMPDYQSEKMKSFYRYVRGNLKYPAEARRAGIEGRVILSLELGENGKVKDAMLIKGIGGGCGKEARRLARTYPGLLSVESKTNDAKMKWILPIVFKLK
ncbi:MAG: TonB family protein [Cytophagales bacterium]|nr:TonB family protein [Cytophagales bacterium]